MPERDGDATEGSRPHPRTWNEVRREVVTGADEAAVARARERLRAMMAADPWAREVTAQLVAAADEVTASFQRLAMVSEPMDDDLVALRQLHAEQRATERRYRGEGVHPGELIDGVPAGGVRAGGGRAGASADLQLVDEILTTVAGRARVTAWESVHGFVALPNPFLTCDTCHRSVRAWHNPERCEWCRGKGWARVGGPANWWNAPCGHVDGVTSTCWSWEPGPGGGCRCLETGWSRRRCVPESEERDE